METPQTDSEPVRGLENLTPRGPNKNKTKNKICFWTFWFFRNFFDQNKNSFFEKSQKFPNFRFSISRFFGFCDVFRFFEKRFFVLIEKKSKKSKFSKTHFIFRFVFIMSSRCQIFKSADRLGIGLRCLHTKSRTYFPKISTRLAFSDISFVIRLYRMLRVY